MHWKYYNLYTWAVYQQYFYYLYCKLSFEQIQKIQYSNIFCTFIYKQPGTDVFAIFVQMIIAQESLQLKFYRMSKKKIFHHHHKFCKSKNCSKKSC